MIQRIVNVPMKSGKFRLPGKQQTSVDDWTIHLPQECLCLSRDLEFASTFQDLHHLGQKWVQSLREDLSSDRPDLLQHDHHFALIYLLAIAYLRRPTPDNLIENPDGILAMI
jgi:hypothetical protein